MSESASNASELYSEESPFVRLLETRGRVRMLDAFLSKYHTEMSADDINKLTGVSQSTFSRNKDVLLELDIIIKTKNKKGKQYYKLNTDSSLVQLLGEFHTKLWKHAEDINGNLEFEKRQYIGEIHATKPQQAAQVDTRDNKSNSNVPSKKVIGSE